ncbi:MAG TPA: hypothetical protein VLJ44_03270 [Gaiellaceae bacterium]|nr:hypothetical protein [Gaiellaceae bacterium]
MIPRLAVIAAVAALVIPAAAGGVDTWASLRRPLHLPVVAPGAACPVSKIDRRINWSRMHIFGGFGIGRGPVYPGLPDGFLMASRDEQYGSTWYGEKVFWFVVPSYRGRVLIRGRRIDAPGRVGFNGTKTPDPELRIEPYDTVSWTGQPKNSRGIPSGVRILTKGCYAFQIDGTTFSRTVVVSADVAS